MASSPTRNRRPPRSEPASSNSSAARIGPVPMGRSSGRAQARDSSPAMKSVRASRPRLLTGPKHEPPNRSIGQAATGSRRRRVDHDARRLDRQSGGFLMFMDRTSTPDYVRGVRMTDSSTEPKRVARLAERSRPTEQSLPSAGAQGVNRRLWALRASAPASSRPSGESQRLGMTSINEAM